MQVRHTGDLMSKHKLREKAEMHFGLIPYPKASSYVKGEAIVDLKSGSLDRFGAVVLFTKVASPFFGFWGNSFLIIYAFLINGRS